MCDSVYFPNKEIQMFDGKCLCNFTDKQVLGRIIGSLPEFHDGDSVTITREVGIGWIVDLNKSKGFHYNEVGMCGHPSVCMQICPEDKTSCHECSIRKKADGEE